MELFTTNVNFFECLNINVIEFGCATSFIDYDSYEHIKKGTQESFRGNMEHASLNKMKFHKTSRRDDLISLFYLLIFLLNGGKVPGIDHSSQGLSEEDF